MTTPSDESAPGAAEAPPGPAEPQPEAAASAAPPAAPTYAQQPVYQPGYDPTFGPVARPPRTPWVNPAKRVGAALISAAAAVVLFGGGLAVGFAAGHHGDGRDVVRMGPGRMDRDDMGPFMQGPGNRNGYGPYGDPNRVYPGGPMHPGWPTTTPTPTPSKTS